MTKYCNTLHAWARTQRSASPAGPKPPKLLPLSALSRWPMILPGKEHGLRKIIDDVCAPLSIQPNVVAEVESLRSVKLAVQGGIGATILPLGSVAEEVASGALRSARLESSAMTRRVVCATSTIHEVRSISSQVAFVERTGHRAGAFVLQAPGTGERRFPAAQAPERRHHGCCMEQRACKSARRRHHRQAGRCLGALSQGRRSQTRLSSRSRRAADARVRQQRDQAGGVSAFYSGSGSRPGASSTSEGL
jgi:hypothetical protein